MSGEEQRDALPVRRRFGPEPLSLFPVTIALLGTLPAAATWPALAWLPVLPLLVGVWVLRARVVVRPDGLLVSNGLGRRLVAWEQVEGFDVPRRGPVRLLAEGRSTPLTAVPRRELRELVRAAERLQGRRPDRGQRTPS